jgi:hypothetical protein
LAELEEPYHMKLNREKLEELLNDVMGFVKDSIATNNRNAESINDLVEINRMLKNEATQEFNEKVRYRKAWQRAIFDKRLLQEELQKSNEAYNEKLHEEETEH